MSKEEKEKAFIKAYVDLCQKYYLALESDDPYCGIKVVPFDREMKKYFRMKGWMEDKK